MIYCCCFSQILLKVPQLCSQHMTALWSNYNCLISKNLSISPQIYHEMVVLIHCWLLLLNELISHINKSAIQILKQNTYNHQKPAFEEDFFQKVLQNSIVHKVAIYTHFLIIGYCQKHLTQAPYFQQAINSKHYTQLIKS